MKIAIASDHAGYELKESIKKILSNFHIVDFGADSAESMDYPDTGFQAAEAVANDTCDRGIVICGSGIGMSIVANKVQGIRAALCQTKEFAVLSRKHNNANVLALSGRFISKYLAKEIIQVWLNTKFDGGRHKRRIDKITKYENK
ncbi:MAG: ribose 5-phosphate isomerase B [Candidatus Cloacimonetes bacterium]|nr:ribose 5-phosphate isomerase B [Candidatus Cloacimonadota bacterium]